MILWLSRRIATRKTHSTVASRELLVTRFFIILLRHAAEALREMRGEAENTRLQPVTFKSAPAGLERGGYRQLNKFGEPGGGRTHGRPIKSRMLYH